MSDNFKNKIIIILLFSIFAGFVSCYYDRQELETLKIAFIRDSDIWVMDENGNNQIQLTFTMNNQLPSWSPDGLRILFQSSRDGNEDVYVIDSDGANLKQLSFTSGADYGRAPTWMPDGNIVYARRSSSLDYFYILRQDGTLIKSVNGSSSPYGISVSPDGEYISYAQGPGTISVVKISDGTITDLSGVGGRGNSHWSNDQNKIYFQWSNSLYSVSYLNPLTENFIVNTGFTLNGLSLTPDERYMYFSNTNNIYKMNMETFAITQITSSASIDSTPCVQGRPI